MKKDPTAKTVMYVVSFVAKATAVRESSTSGCQRDGLSRKRMRTSSLQRTTILSPKMTPSP